MKKRRIVGILTTLILLFTFTSMINAAEYAEENNMAVRLRWVYKENSQFTLPVGYNLPSGHGAISAIGTAIPTLNSQTPSNIKVKSVPYSNSKVDFIVAGADGWNKFIKDGNNGSIPATTVPKSTNGDFYIGYSSLPSTGTVQIDYAMIWYNPTYDSMMSGGMGTRMAMHEMMHCFGMGHNSKDSLVNPAGNPTSTKVTSYDLQEFRRMYP